MNSTELQDKIKVEVSSLLKTAAELYDAEFPEIPVLFNVRGNAAGRFSYKYDELTEVCSGEAIKFNLAMIELNGYDRFKNTVIHEVAHYVNRFLNGQTQMHGELWKKIFLDMGGNGKTTHNLEIPPKAPKIKLWEHPKLEAGKYYLASVQTREEAFDNFQKTYWSGTKCEFAHESPRYVRTDECKECYRLYREAQGIKKAAANK